MTRDGHRSLAALGRSVWAAFDAGQRRGCVAVLLLSMLAGGLTLAGVAGIAPFLAVLADPEAVGRNAVLARLQAALALESRDDFLLALGLGFVGMVVLANAANLLTVVAIGRFAQRAVASFQVLLFEEYLSRPFAFHARHHGDVLASHVVQEVARSVGGVIQSGLLLVANLAVIALIAAAVVVVDPVVALGATLALALVYAAIYAFVRRRLVREGEALADRWQQRSKAVAESFAAIQDVILHGVEREMVDRLAGHADAIAAAQARTAAIAATPRYAIESVVIAGLVAVALATRRGPGGDQGLAQLAFLGFAAYRLLPPVQQVFASLARIRADGVGCERIAVELSRARARAPLRDAGGDAAARPLAPEVRLTGVSYRHSPDGVAGVRDVSLRIPAGALVGFAGPNGSGKTTLANLILGLLVPQAGAVLVDGEPLDDGNRRRWRATVAHVPQQVLLLDASVAENVAFGVRRDAIDHERLWEAVRAAQLEPVVAALPAGLATAIGRNGVRLSGGQRQRLGIARALYRRASLLVLDEATGGLDAAAEAEIMGVLAGLRGRCTVVLIAHAPGVLDTCDVVFELEDGLLVRTRARASHARAAAPVRRATEGRG
ncbi:MAG TPA: ABC transporter ATP-binding protein [Gammaproteobacteria bacterium]